MGLQSEVDRERSGELGPALKSSVCDSVVEVYLPGPVLRSCGAGCSCAQVPPLPPPGNSVRDFANRTPGAGAAALAEGRSPCGADPWVHSFPRCICFFSYLSVSVFSDGKSPSSVKRLMRFPITFSKPWRANAAAREEGVCGSAQLAGQAVLRCAELERKRLPFCSQWSHSHNHLLLILSATSIKLFVETN